LTSRGRGNEGVSVVFFVLWGHRVLRWVDKRVRCSICPWEEIGEHYGRYRLHVPEAERAMARSLERYGQLSPVVVCRRQDRYERNPACGDVSRRWEWRRQLTVTY
jgi:hypothetical protein